MTQENKIKILEERIELLEIALGRTDRVLLWVTFCSVLSLIIGNLLMWGIIGV